MRETTTVNWSIKIVNLRLLKDASQRTKIPMSRIINQLIEDRFSNPLEAIKTRRKELAKEMNELAERESRLEKMMESQKDSKAKSNWEMSPKKRGGF